jgi:hypothetical protein
VYSHSCALFSIPSRALAHAGVQKEVQFLPGQHQPLAFGRPLAQQRRQHDPVARVGVDQSFATGVRKQALRGDQQHVRFAPGQRACLDERDHVGGLDLAHGQRPELGETW